MLRVIVSLFIGIATFGVGSCLSRADAAEVSPDAELRRQLERQTQERQRLEASKPDVRLNVGAENRESVAQMPVEQPCFVIDRLSIQGIDGQSVEGFDWLWPLLVSDHDASVHGRCVGAQGVAWLVDRGQKILVHNGYVTSRLLAAPQDMSQGQLVLTLVPGRIRAIRWGADTQNEHRLVHALPMQPGDVLQLRDIEQALENLKRV